MQTTESTISKTKRIAKNSAFLYIRMFLTMAVSLYTVRVVVETLSIQDYGLYGAVGGIILSFGLISGVLTNASQRFFSVEIGRGESGKLWETFNTLFLAYFLITLLIVALAETLGLWFLLNKMTIPNGREDAAFYVYQFALLSFVVTLLATPFQALIIAYEKMNLYAYLSILDVILKLGVIYALVIFDVDKLIQYAILMFIVTIITNSVYVLYCYKNYNVSHLNFRIDTKILKTIFSYNSWTFLGTLAGMCNTQGMNLMLNVFFGTLANAAYTVSHQIYNTVAMFANNFYIAVKPVLIKDYAVGNYDYVSKLFYFSSKALFLLMYVIVLPVIICTKDILQIWLGEVGEYMVVFVQLSLIYTIILIISYPITAIIQAGGNVKLYHGVVDGFSLVTLPIIYILFRFNFSAYWAYLVSIVVFGIAHILRLYVLKKEFSYFSIHNYIRQFIVPSIIVVLISFFIMVPIKIYMPQGLIWVLITCAISSLVAIIAGTLIVLSKSDRKMIFNMIIKRK